MSRNSLRIFLAVFLPFASGDNSSAGKVLVLILRAFKDTCSRGNIVVCRGQVWISIVSGPLARQNWTPHLHHPYLLPFQSLKASLLMSLSLSSSVSDMSLLRNSALRALFGWEEKEKNQGFRKV